MGIIINVKKHHFSPLRFFRQAGDHHKTYPAWYFSPFKEDVIDDDMM